MDFNASEAAKSRDWTQFMSNTAHQREVADLRAAGLNPVLSASGGNGAAVTSGVSASSHAGQGSTGQVDTSTNAALTGVLSTLLSAQNNMEMTRVNAQNNLAIAEKYNATNELIGRLQAGASYGAAVLTQKGAMDRQVQQQEWTKSNPTNIEQGLTRIFSDLGVNSEGVTNAGSGLLQGLIGLGRAVTYPLRASGKAIYDYYREHVLGR